MNVRDIVRVDVDGRGNWRPGVVIRTDTPHLRIAYGGRTEPPSTSVSAAVHPNTRAGRALELRDLTWFQGGNACFARAGEVQPTGKACPVDLYLKLVQMVRDHDAAVEAGLIGGDEDKL